MAACLKMSNSIYFRRYAVRRTDGQHGKALHSRSVQFNELLSEHGCFVGVSDQLRDS